MQALSLSNLLDPEVRADPYALYARMRITDPVYWDESMGFWVATRYVDAMAILHDHRFMKAQGLEVGRSKVEDDKLDLARDLVKLAQGREIKLALPQDHVVADKIDAGARAEVVGRGAIPRDRIGVDIGPATRAEYAREIARSKMIVWNGPMGVFEIPQFAQGTLEMARAVAASPATSIVGGGDSVAAVIQAGVASKITHISTGGGASLEFLSGMKLPGVEALTDRQSVASR